MSAADVVVLVAAVVACAAAAVCAVAAGVLVGQVRRLERGIEELRAEAVPLVHEARLAAGQAVAELERVDAVLAGTESVTATVDGAARLAQRAFASPVVKLLAWRAGAIGGWRRLRQPSPGDGPAGRSRRGTVEVGVGVDARAAVPAPNAAPPSALPAAATNGTTGTDGAGSGRGHIVGRRLARRAP